MTIHKVKKVMGMFSKELLELDRNTEEYMIDEMQKEIDGLKKKLRKPSKKRSRNRFLQPISQTRSSS